MQYTIHATRATIDAKICELIDWISGTVGTELLIPTSLAKVGTQEFAAGNRQIYLAKMQRDGNVWTVRIQKKGLVSHEV